jgi:hypothetical protein
MYVDLDDVLVDRAEILQQLVLELLLSEVGRLAQARSEQREVRVVLLVVEEKHGLGLAPVDQVVSHLLELVHGLLDIGVLDESSNGHLGGSTLSCLFLLHHHGQTGLGSNCHVLEKAAGLGL